MNLGRIMRSDRALDRALQNLELPPGATPLTTASGILASASAPAPQITRQGLLESDAVLDRGLVALGLPGAAAPATGGARILSAAGALKGPMPWTRLAAPALLLIVLGAGAALLLNRAPIDERGTEHATLVRSPAPVCAVTGDPLCLANDLRSSLFATEALDPFRWRAPASLGPRSGRVLEAPSPVMVPAPAQRPVAPIRHRLGDEEPDDDDDEGSPGSTEPPPRPTGELAPPPLFADTSGADSTEPAPAADKGTAPPGSIEAPEQAPPAPEPEALSSESLTLRRPAQSDDDGRAYHAAAFDVGAAGGFGGWGDLGWTAGPVFRAQLARHGQRSGGTRGFARGGFEAGVTAAQGDKPARPGLALGGDFGLSISPPIPFRLDLGWALHLRLLPPLRDARHIEDLRAGWFFATTGPAITLRAGAPGRPALHARFALETAVMDLGQYGRPRLLPWPTLALGVELPFAFIGK